MSTPADRPKLTTAAASAEAGRAGGQVREHLAQPGRRPGRPPGESGAREAIVAAALDVFAEHGYDRATIRAIAAAAGVDPALVIHYFGSKEQLFGTVLELPLAPGQILREALISARDDLGKTIVRSFLEAWEPPENRPRLVAMVRSAMTNDVAQCMVRTYIEAAVFEPLTEVLGVADAHLRATLVGSQFIGLAMMRYVVCIEPVVSASIDQLVAAVGPTVQRYLTGDLEGM